MKPPDYLQLVDQLIRADNGKRYAEVLLRSVGPAPGGKYRHWDKMRYVPPPEGLSSEEWWLATKLARHSLYVHLPLTDKEGTPFRFAMVDSAWSMLHRIDRDASGAIRGSDPGMPDTYLIKTLVEEAITSSQLEGAATTRQVAKEMLRQRRKPRNRSEQMIFNNYQAMQFIRELDKDHRLTLETVLELQRIVTVDTLDDPGDAGTLRKESDDVKVVDETGTILHIPSSAAELPDRLAAMCEFANAGNGTPFVHPVVRATLLHFWLAYDHPFVDGNGRTARALFYWAMARYGYWLCEYLSISRIIRRAPAKYARAFLYAENDDNDATYFIIDQLEVICRAIRDLHSYLKHKAQELYETELLIRKSAPIKALLNHRQLAVINHALKNPYTGYTFESHRNSHDISYQTARTDLLELSELNLLDQMKSGRTFVFRAPPDLRARLEKLRDHDGYDLRDTSNGPRVSSA